ncbi:hypothetical protein SLS63_005135 [Diaporthe eres]|uniref:C2H2-type domain-containing protein n=1 Tax=Diaporthe eres TaxID=83184 RepID=A0ABR1PBF9_DIAER
MHPGIPSAQVESPSTAGSCARPEAEMANERRLNKSAARTPRHGSSSTTTTTIAGSSNSSSSSGGSSSTVNATSGGKKQSRQYRLPHPPVPHAQTSLLQSQRVPASVVAYPTARQVGYESPQLSDSRYYASSGRGGGLATTATTTTAAAGGLAASASATAAAAAAVEATDGSTEAAVPSADPDVMEAKKGLNKWGAFDSLSGSGTGTFGFGPLLFHHVDETPRDPYDTTNMMLNDPISFNPMSAISWARLDESPDSVDELEGDISSAARQPDMAIAAAASAGAGGGRRDGSSSRGGYVDSPASTTASPQHGSGASYTSDVSDSRTSSVAGSSVGNISRTFSDTSLVSPDTERSTAPAPTAFTSPSSSRAPNPLAGQQQQQQQQQQQHQQLGRQTEASVQYGTQQPPSNRSSASNRATANHQPYSSQSYAHTRPQQQAQSSNRHRHQQTQQSTQSRPQQQQQQRQPQQPQAPTASLPAQQTPATTDLLLCLGPHCSARFPTEQELAAHYRAEHAFTCTWTSCSAASFTSSNALAWHVNAEHLLTCPVPGCCGATFGSKRALDGHLKVSSPWSR